MICKVYSGDINGIDVFRICVEADVSPGLPGFNMVGLPSSEVREARERVERAIINSGFEFPARRITINLSPANLRKQGSGFDLPIAVSVLAAAGVIKPDVLEDKMFTGELSLDGGINPIRGVLPIAVFAKENSFKWLIVPAANAFEGAAVDGMKIHSARDLRSLVIELNTGQLSDVEHMDLEYALEHEFLESNLDYKDVVGQESAKKATMVAVAGFHNLLYIGPPGAGKSMMAKRIPTIFNRLSIDECLEISKIYSIAGLLQNDSLVLSRPFRAPHQSITDSALLGGQANPRPGEITLAHKGVLFLDELAEFKKNTINELRTPLEEKKIIISRSYRQAEFPCDFMLAAATNPCRCGFYPDRRFCTCNESEVAAYLSKIKGPLMDRIDICAVVERVDAKSLGNIECGMTSAFMRDQVKIARDVQIERFKDCDISFNSQMGKTEIDRFCILDDECEKMLMKAYDRLHMTARGWHKIMKVARTIADLDGSDRILKEHLLEAISYRNSYINR